MLAVLKLFLAFLLLPIVIGITIAFLDSLREMKTSVAAAFGWGVVVYLILHILLYEPATVYDTGKKIAEKAMSFFSPLVKVAGFCVPIFTILSFVAYFFASVIWKQSNFFGYFVFLASFMLTMHLVFTANSLKGKQAGAMRENYFFALFIIYIVNILIVAGAFSLLSYDFSFLSFIRKVGHAAGAIYTVSFRQLFDVEHRPIR
ncbi:MAG: hypothetical protein V1863_03300 [Candidatus Omnitrophota bacterium]